MALLLNSHRQGLSISQISSVTNTTSYGNIISPVNIACPITHEPFDDNDEVMQINACKHIFKRNNLLTWFRTSTCCPICLIDLSESIHTRNTVRTSILRDVADFQTGLWSRSMPDTRNEAPRLDDFIRNLTSSMRDGLSEAEISENTTRDIYGHIQHPVNTECPISQEAFNIDDDVLQITSCRHIFKRDCLLSWFRTGTGCPLCRVDLRRPTAATGISDIFEINISRRI